MAVLDKTRYMELVDKFPLVPIETEDELDRAQEVLDSLTDHPDSITEQEKQYCVVLRSLIAKYESIHYPVEKASGRELLEFLIEQHNLTLDALAEHIGSHKSNLSSYLSGKRGISKEVALGLANYFGLDACLFLYS